MNKSARIISTIFYIFGDIIYVMQSAKFYEAFMIEAGQMIPPIHDRWHFALAAYLVMSMGWYTFVIPVAYAWKESQWCPWRIGLLIGVVYGLTVIGTFNFTLAALLPFWFGWIVWRDIAWAIGWNTLMLWVYFFVLPYQTKDPL